MTAKGRTGGVQLPALRSVSPWASPFPTPSLSFSLHKMEVKAEATSSGHRQGELSHVKHLAGLLVTGNSKNVSFG